MSKNQNTFIKKQKAELKKRKQKDKLEKKLSRKEDPKSGKLEDMMAYVDQYGNISETPPEDEKPVFFDDFKHCFFLFHTQLQPLLNGATYL